MGKFIESVTGKKEEEIFRFPSAEESIKKIWKQPKSSYPLRLLGTGGEDVYISEEERESHMHIIGTTREGKSKFLEHLIRGDIDQGNGLCFFDPSDRGDTLYRILAYCEKKKYKKVLLIDPHHFYTRNIVCPISPFGKYRESSVTKTMDTLRVLYGQSEWFSTPVIKKYLRAVLNLLHNANLTLAESEHFARPKAVFERAQILSKTDPDDRQREAIEAALGTPSVKRDHVLFAEYQSTVRRLEELFHPVIQTMFSSKVGIDFADLIADGWVVLVNLYRWYGIEKMQTRLLGTAIINEIIEAIDRLKAPKKNQDGTTRKPWRGRYYLYIDEAGEYVTEKLTEMLTLKSKSGVSVVLAHQYYDQFDDKKVLKAIQNNCKIKVGFYVVDDEDRLKLVRMMYGGELNDRDVSFGLSKLRKQHAVVKVNKDTPHIVRVPNVPDLPQVSEGYLDSIYSNPIYKPLSEIEQEVKNRLRIVEYQTRSTTTQEQRNLRNETRRKTSRDNLSSQPPTKTDDKPNSESSLRKSGVHLKSGHLS
jgi:hypothetical protein